MTKQNNSQVQPPLYTFNETSVKSYKKKMKNIFTKEQFDIFFNIPLPEDFCTSSPNDTNKVNQFISVDLYDEEILTLPFTKGTQIPDIDFARFIKKLKVLKNEYILTNSK